MIALHYLGAAPNSAIISKFITLSLAVDESFRRSVARHDGALHAADVRLSRIITGESEAGDRRSLIGTQLFAARFQTVKFRRVPDNSGIYYPALNVNALSLEV